MNIWSLKNDHYFLPHRPLSHPLAGCGFFINLNRASLCGENLPWRLPTSHDNRQVNGLRGERHGSLTQRSPLWAVWACWSPIEPHCITVSALHANVPLRGQCPGRLALPTGFTVCIAWSTACPVSGEATEGKVNHVETALHWRQLNRLLIT